MTSKRVLVAYGSKHGATAGIADELGKTLREDRFDTAVQSADSVTDLNGYDAVVLGGALYAGRWNGECARRNEEQLRHRAVWLFSSGPVDSSAEQRGIPPVHGMARWMKRLGAREHTTFGGALAADAPGRFAQALVRRGRGGDFRNPERIQEWARHIAGDLTRLR